MRITIDTMAGHPPTVIDLSPGQVTKAAESGGHELSTDILGEVGKVAESLEGRPAFNMNEAVLIDPKSRPEVWTRVGSTAHDILMIDSRQPVDTVTRELLSEAAFAVAGGANAAAVVHLSAALADDRDVGAGKAVGAIEAIIDTIAAGEVVR